MSLQEITVGQVDKLTSLFESNGFGNFYFSNPDGKVVYLWSKHEYPGIVEQLKVEVGKTGYNLEGFLSEYSGPLSKTEKTFDYSTEDLETVMSILRGFVYVKSTGVPQ